MQKVLIFQSLVYWAMDLANFSEEVVHIKFFCLVSLPQVKYLPLLLLCDDTSRGLDLCEAPGTMVKVSGGNSPTSTEVGTSGTRSGSVSGSGAASWLLSIETSAMSLMSGKAGEVGGVTVAEGKAGGVNEVDGEVGDLSRDAFSIVKVTFISLGGVGVLCLGGEGVGDLVRCLLGAGSEQR